MGWQQQIEKDILRVECDVGMDEWREGVFINDREMRTS